MIRSTVQEQRDDVKKAMDAAMAANADGTQKWHDEKAIAEEKAMQEAAEEAPVARSPQPQAGKPAVAWRTGRSRRVAAEEV